MKLGAKIGGGFGVLNVIVLILGGLALVSLLSIDSMSSRMDRKYMPISDVSSQIQPDMLKARYQMRVFIDTGDSKYYQNFMKETEPVVKGIKTLEALAKEAPEIHELPPLVAKLDKTLNDYKALAKLMNDGFVKVAEADKAIDENAGKSRDVLAKYFSHMRSALTNEIKANASAEKIEERLSKIDTANHITAAMEGAKASNYQAKGNFETANLEKSAAELEKLLADLSATMKATKVQANKELIKQVIEEVECVKASVASHAQAKKILKKQLADIVDIGVTVLTLSENISDLGVKSMKELSSKTQARAKLSSLVVGIGLAISLAAGILLAVFITRMITKPVAEVASLARRLAAGDFTTKLAIESKDELGRWPPP
jgi:methyl-accepting chemotaxis protein